MVMVKVIEIAEVPTDSRKVVDVGEYKVLVIHTGDKYFAVENRCPHMHFPLKNGKVTEDHGIVCPFHHSAFDLESGDVKTWSPWPPVVGKALGALAREKALPVFETMEKDGWLWISDKPKV